jgi:hypothetical protein
MMRKLYLKLFFLVFSALGTSVFAQYCAPTFSSGCSFGDQILNFNTTGGVSNITNNGSGCSAGYYQYFAGQSVSQLQGQDVTLNMQAGPTWGQGFKVWIDWNNNLSFADAGELVYTSPGSGIAVNSTVVTVPFSATVGTVRMRVVCSYAGIPPAMDGCPVNQTYGECEDYDFVVLASASCSGTPTAGTAVASSASICPSVNYTLSLSGATLAAGLTYQWQSAPSATGPWTNIPTGTTPSFITSQTVDTWYQCIVTCSGLSATSSVVGVTTNSFLACYCTSTATSTFDEEILNVTLNTLNNTSACGVAAPGPGSTASQYSNYTTLTPTILSPGVVYPLSVEIGTCNGSYTNCTKVWIDFNQNGLFTDAGENVYSSPASSVGPHFELGNITIPAGALSGNTMMRVVNVETWDPANINPCGTYTWGETEDYLVNISAPPTCPQPTNFSLIQANNTTAQVEWVAGGSETQWQIEYGPQGFTPGTGTSVIVTTNPYTITGLTTNSFYQAYIQGICTPGDTSYFTPPVAWNTYNQGQFVDWDNACPTNGYEDISGFATNANLNDDQEVGVTMPFTFLYQGALVNTMTIGDNGGVILNTTSGQVNYNMPASGSGLFPYIQDLWTGGNAGQAVYYGQVGNTPTAKFIVQWTNVPHYGFPASTNGASFQIVIDQATNEIYYVYDDVEMGNAGWDNGADAEIGLRGPNNVNVSMNNSAYLQDNSCVHFYYTNCPKPTSFATSYVAPDEAMITWNAGAAAETNWTIIYGPTGFNPATAGTTTTATTNSAILTGLNQLTTYDVYIYADCAVGLQSLGLDGSFTTPPFCSNPTNLYASTAVDSLMSSWSWTGYSAQYPSTSFNLQMVLPGAALYTGTIYNLDNNTTDTTYDSEFMAGQTFDIYVQAVCGQDTSFYVGPFNVVFPLTNDTICGAQMIPVNGQMYMFNNTGATFDVAELAMVPPATGAQTTTGWANQNLEMTTWFKFVAPTSGAVRINCTGVNYNGQMAVYSAGACNNIASFQMMAANDDDLGGVNQAPNFTVCGLTPGTEYHMMHDAFNFTAGNYAISIYEIVLNAGVEGEQLEVCYGDTVNLFLGIANYQLEGTWSETTPTLGLNDNLFNTNGLASTLYEFTYTVQDGCASDDANAYVQIYSAPNPGVGGTINVCLNEPFNLVSGISGLVDLDGVWYNNISMQTLAGSVDTSGTTGGNVTYTYTASNGVCPDESTTVTVVVNGGCDFTAGIDELAAGFELYPNPTRSSVAISWTAKGETTLTLTDLNGKVLLNAMSQASQYAMDLSNFAPGVYIVSLQNGDQLLTERIIKQ